MYLLFVMLNVDKMFHVSLKIETKSSICHAYETNF